MKNTTGKTFEIIFNSLLFSSHKEVFLDRFIEMFISEFELGSAVQLVKKDNKYSLKKSLVTKIPNLPEINSEDELIKFLTIYRIAYLNEKRFTIESKLPSILRDISFEIIFLFNNSENILLVENKSFPLDQIEDLKKCLIDFDNIFQNYDEISKSTFSNKLSFISPLFRTLSHDVRNPIQMISILTEMLQAKELPYEKRLSLYTKINDGLSQITNLVSEISDLSKNQFDLNIEKTDCEKYFNDIQNSISDSLKKLKIEFELYSECKNNIFIDQKKIKSCLLKIIKFSRELIQYEGLISCSIKNVDNDLIISIQDTSEGIDQNIYNNIFNPFYFEPNKKFNGINFAIVQRIIQLHKGNISIKTSFSEGVNYLIIIPVLTPPI